MSDPLFVAEGIEFSAIVTGERTVVGLQIGFKDRVKLTLRLPSLRALRVFIDSILVDAADAPSPPAAPEGWEVDAEHPIAWFPSAHGAKHIAVWNAVHGALQVTNTGDCPDIPLSVLRALLATKGLRVLPEADALPAPFTARMVREQGYQLVPPKAYAVLRAMSLIPDEAIGWRGASPGAVWEPAREAERVKRGLPEREAGRRAPVQGSHRIPRGQPGHSPGTITWEEHEQAWADYAKRYGRSQSAERLAERAGFCYRELTDHLGHPPTTWEPLP